MIELLIIFLLCLTVITAAGVVRVDNLFAAVMLMGILSLLMAVVFFLLDAADVALTEAAVGAGISTVLLLSALALTTDREQRPGVRRGLALVVVLVTALVILRATVDMPVVGDPLAPVHLHVVPEYFRMTRELVDIPNVVTAVLAAFRGYDTLGEVIVVFTAGIGVLFLIGPDAPKGGVSPSGGDLTPEGLKHHQPLRIVGKIAIPFILLFAFYVQFHGEYSPGGGFQAGTLLAAAVILYALLEGEQRAMDVIPHGVLLGLAAGGALLYGGVGLLCMLLGGQFLQYDVLWSEPVIAQQFGIIAIEAGVGMAVAGTLLLVFHAFASRDSS